MRFVTENGTEIETLDIAGHSTPYLYKGWYHLHLVVNGRHCEPMQVQRAGFERDRCEMTESAFWEQCAADALMNQDALDAYRKAGSPNEAQRLL